MMYTQIANPNPQPPPLADQAMRFVGYANWLAIFSGVLAVIYAGGRFAWQKWGGPAMDSGKMVAGAMIGGVVSTSAGTIMNTVLH